MLTFEIPGTPVPKGRPRFVRKTGHVYTPKRTKEFEEKVALIAKAHAKKAKWNCTDQPLSMSCKIYHRHGSADIDNIFKSTADGIQNSSAVFENDKQIIHMEAVVLKGPPKSVIEIRTGHEWSLMADRLKTAYGLLAHTVELLRESLDPEGAVFADDIEAFLKEQQ